MNHNQLAFLIEVTRRLEKVAQNKKNTIKLKQVIDDYQIKTEDLNVITQSLMESFLKK